MPRLAKKGSSLELCKMDVEDFKLGTKVSEHQYLQFSFDLRTHRNRNTTEHKTHIDLIFISTLNKIMLLYKHINWCFNYKSISVKTWKNKTVIFTLRNERLWNVTVRCSEKKSRPLYIPECGWLQYSTMLSSLTALHSSIQCCRDSCLFVF